MADDMNILVGVKVDADSADIQSQINSISPRPQVRADVVIDSKAGKDISKQMERVSTSAKVHITPSINLSEFENAVRSSLRHIKNKPVVHLRAELEKESLDSIRASLQTMVNDLVKNTPELNLGNLFGGNGAKGVQQQAEQVQKSINKVSQTLKGLDRVHYDIAPNQRELKNTLLQFGMPKKDVDAVVKEIEAGEFRIQQAKARFAQRVVNEGKGKRRLTEEALQSVSIAGTTADGVNAVKTLTWNEQTQGYAMSTQLGMTLDEQGRVIQAAEKATQQAKKIDDLLAKLSELESQAFNRRQPIKGDNATTLRDSIGNIRDNLQGDTVDLAQAERDIKALDVLIKNYKASQKAVNELGDISVADKVKRLESTMDTYKQEAGHLVGALNADTLVAEAQKVQDAFDAMDMAFGSARNAGDNATSTQWDAYTKSVKDYKEAVTQATNAQKRLTTQQKAVGKAGDLSRSLMDANMVSEAVSLNNAIERVVLATERLQDSTDSSDLQEYADAMKALTDSTKQYGDELARNQKNSILQDRLEKQMQTITKIRNEWSKAMSNQGNVDQLSGIERSLKVAADAGNKIEFDKATRQLQIFQATMKATGQATQTFADKMKRLAGEFTQWFSVSNVIMKLHETAKKMISTNTEIDSSMTELKKVTDGSAASYERFSDRAVEKAKDLKTTITDVIDASAGWSRVGYGMNEAEDLGKWSIIYANVGDDIENIDAATKSLISTLKGFGNEGNTTVGQAERIVNIFNKLGNSTSISSGQLGESLQHSAAALSEANNTLSESAALTVGAYDVLQNSAEVGNMWKTVSMRIRGAKTEIEAAGEDTEGMAESTSKLRKQVKAMTGFDIMASANEFKSTYDIIVGIGEVWGSLSDINQASLLELLAGKNRGNALAAALNNVEAIKEAYQMAEDSAGSATAEYGVFEESVEAHAKRAEAAMQAFSKSALSTDLINMGYDAFSGVLDGLTGISDVLTSIPTLATAASTALTLLTGKGRSIVIYAPLREFPLAA